MDSSESDQTGSTSSSLLMRVRNADEDAWKRLVQLYGPLVYTWCRNAHLQSDDLADVFQDVFAAVHRGIGEFRADRPGDTFRGWLRTITYTKLMDGYRRRSAEPVGAGGSRAAQMLRELPAEDSDASEEASRSENGALVRRAAELVQAEFEPHTWRAFWEVVVEGRTTKDVAAELDMSVAAIRQAKSRVLRRLREEFTDLLDFTAPASN